VALLGWAAGAVAAYAAPPKDKLTPAEVRKAETAVKAELARLEGSHALVTHIKNGPLQRSLPGYAFFAVRYRQYAAGEMPPPSLSPSNVFAVCEDKVEALTDMKELERYFKAHLSPRTTDERLKDSARAWVRVAQELHQDGYFKFALEDGATKVLERPGGSRIAVGKGVVKEGGGGVISARLVFNKAGMLTMVSEDSKIRKGDRPKP
jgi:hypothetical protein